MRLIVCPARHLAAVCAERSPSCVIQLVAPGKPEPDLVSGARQLVLRFNDITEPRRGLVAPDHRAMEALLDFGRRWNEVGPLVVSCEAGVSRSTAAAFCLACQARPDRLEHEVADALRSAAPTATPNALMVALADGSLQRGGRMVAAAAAIGRGADHVPYRSFELSLPRASPRGRNAVG